MKTLSLFLVGNRIAQVGNRWFCLFLLTIVGFLGSVEEGFTRSEPIPVFVSIPPQAYFVERVGGDRVSVSVLVGPGQSPATFEPTPRQMVALSKAQIYFRIGIHFEKVWMTRIANNNPQMKVIDTRENVPMRTIEDHHHECEEGLHTDFHDADHDHEHDHDRANDPDHDHEGEKDPHIWLSPKLVKIQARTICDGLVAIDPEGKTHYETNLSAFLEDLDRLDQEVHSILKTLRTRKFLVFHPSWGYFADEYQLQQFAIEAGGKEPSAKQLADLIDLTKREQVQTIFIQPQFDQRIANSIAKTIDGTVVAIDPLEKDYIKNFKDVALRMHKAMQ